MFDFQEAIEKRWPFPGKSNFNLTARDLFISLLFFVALYFMRILILIPLIYEPALLAFPFNTISSLMLRTPRFWLPLTVEPKLQLLLDDFPKIRNETLEIVKKPLPLFSTFAQQGRIATNQDWRVFPFFSHGKIHEENCKRAPKLSSIILQIPSIRLAMLSVIEEGTYIKPHCGYFKSILRVHLTIYTEHEDTEMKRYIEVGGERYSWKEGELVAFDDSYMHSVKNTIPGKRVVLFLDVERPYQTKFSSVISSIMHSLFKSSPLITSLAAAQETNSRSTF